MKTTPDFIEAYGDAERVAQFANEHIADIVEALNDLPHETSARIVTLLSLERATDVLDQPGIENSSEIISRLPEDRAVALLEAMSADRRADIFRELQEPARAALLTRLSPESQGLVIQLLVYPEGSAGAIMTTEFVSVLSTATVGQTLHYIRVVERTRETVYSIYVLDSVTQKLLKAVTLRQLIAGSPEDSILSVAPQRPTLTADPLMDQADVARLISKYDLLAVPVVDSHNHVLGIVTVDDIIDSIVAENTEDAQKFGGMAPLDEPYMGIGFIDMLKKRAG